MTIAIHTPTGRRFEVAVYKDGRARIALYVVGDKNWKRKDRQLRPNLYQAVATARRGECYIAVREGGKPRSLMCSRNFTFVP